ncbi:small secreted protein [Drepanopeziza brunnea f. sp. 'multigermtubi' MB_m1]|uniref:NADH dehydrogenase [ubiquinone] 1 alpha subcomplex subunit 1 n=1 Tax=Marssonina brunnea f. sp. multigermtubi (strain MB_m1) TaxID=1072389 RepID=K1Y5A2_MARBU|nr:small secreted protein [Drepanopeziza brunnea f. sp. 'multigermtubi' MB_m1]EKD20354.1 small secreted protein [Drepanopeziza brunnea f. sp. 'multigermtubi' MB_m1]
MGVPFEALIPYGIMLAMFGITGAGMSKIRHMQNGGKRGRHSVDQWDKIDTEDIAELIEDSDGPGPQIDGIPEGTNGQPNSTRWL